MNEHLNFTDADRVENIRRVAQVARLMVDAGLIVLASFSSPFRAERCLARNLVQEGEFCKVFVDALLGVAESRDTMHVAAGSEDDPYRRLWRIVNFLRRGAPNLRR